MTVEIRRASPSFVTRERGRSTRHSFSFGDHYDPDNLRFGPIVCHDDHLLGSDQGFEDHPHSDLEIVTWVLTGALLHTHTDPASGGEVHEGRVGRGEVQVLGTGSGVVHAERADPSAGPVRFVQVWLAGAEPAAVPSYDVAPVTLPDGELVPVASSREGAGAVRLATPGATFSVARLPAGATLLLPEQGLVHVYVARGALQRSSLAEPLHEGDGYRITDRPGLVVTAAVPTELLVWELEA
ncbi:pirin family protein [Nocardioides sp. KIGAM211]|uniref:Pirin family protein n=1 Tax=Nocardioides luti TaxID=2761101 RepID=A0A7X0RH16_9ACTN|nr:pirin family protein [Nocardioides luti]